MTPFGWTAIALAVSLSLAGALGWLLVREHDALVLQRQATAQARAETAAVQAVRTRERAAANDAYGQLQVRCQDENQRAADAGREIGRIVNAPNAAGGGRRVVGPDELRVIAGESPAARGLPAQPQRRR